MIVGEPIILGSRGSELARAQTSMVVEALRRACPDVVVSIRIITTRGDDRKQEPIDPRAGRKGLFTGEIERALLAGEIDIAVHSAKDLPSDTTAGLEVRGALPRAPVEDLLIRKFGGDHGSVIATGSVRRQHQLRWKYPGKNVIGLRGNVPTRLRKLLASDWNGIVLARAGLERLGYDVSVGAFAFEDTSLAVEILSPADFLPAGGQGVIALQVRAGDDEARAIVDSVNHPETLLCLGAEREFLRLLQGDCGSPVGVLGTIADSEMTLRAQIFGPERIEPRTASVKGEATSAAQLAQRLWDSING
ncbi:MAG: hydroxymethylbilane synthase [Verrucomicrobiota bacterium]|jgi:hydroxymethylbilane synthase